mmetsp:Transcript_159049/g.290075  ORF Transcript_159049/g.290075 Transcript_159049/m.290075 type:complete len:249 (+) Transcript_159049:44-790(+)
MTMFLQVQQQWATPLITVIGLIVVGSEGLFLAPAKHALTDVTVDSNPISYFGCGCFWHVQHEFITNFESRLLGRAGLNFTAFAGYAGGTEVGEDGLVCYHNGKGIADYGEMGHAEVVSLAVDPSNFKAAAEFFFDNVCPGGLRADPQDVGTEYRSLVGFSGGLESAAGKAFAEVAKQKNVKVVAGKGDDADVSGTVYVMDTTAFPFYQAEIYHQFHDDMLETYSAKYHSLQSFFVDAGVLQETGCPEQ